MAKEGERESVMKSKLEGFIVILIQTMLFTTHENIQLVWQYGRMKYGGMNSLGGRHLVF